MIGVLLVLLLCTLIGYLIGRPDLGLVIGIVVVLLATWANWYRV
jgi:hypothetical protein